MSDVRGVEVDENDVAPVESHSCPVGHRVAPGARSCTVCGTAVGVPHPARPRDTRTLLLWVLVGAAFVTLLHVAVIALVLAMRQ